MTHSLQRSCGVLWLSMLVAVSASAQQVMLDRAVKAGELWCFPSATNPDHYYYVPQGARLVKGDRGRPKLSLLRYVVNRVGDEASDEGIRQADGGGILHMLVTYDTPRAMVDAAGKALAGVSGREEPSLRGPILFESGSYHFVSSIVGTSEDGEPVLLATGRAPVLEGGQIALSFELDARSATLLLKSLEQARPDVSLVFEMTIRGLTEAYDAELRVDWDSVYDHEAFQAGAEILAPDPVTGMLLGFGGEIGSLFDELQENKSIELVTRGENAAGEALIEKAYSRLVDLLLQPITPEDEADKGVMGKLAKAMDEDPARAGRKPVLGVGASLGYRTKRIEKSGRTTIHLNAQSAEERSTTLVLDLGAAWKEHQGDPEMFRTVNLADPAFQQREIHVGIDGAILPEFDQYINSVTTTLRKRHEDGSTTLREIVIDRTTFNRDQNDFRMIYGWKGDSARSAWLDYEYATRWSFKGGGVFETGWQDTSANMIDLYAPYRRRRVKVLGDPVALRELGVRAVVVQIEHPFFSETKRQRLTLRTDEAFEDPALELTLPLESRAYEYKITWIRQEGPRLSETGTSSAGLIFVDEPPIDQTDTALGSEPRFAGDGRR